MKIIRHGWLHPDKILNFDNIPLAVADKIEPNFSDTEKKRVRDRTNNQTEMLGKLIDILFDRKLLDKQELQMLLGSEYRIEE